MRSEEAICAARANWAADCALLRPPADVRIGDGHDPNRPLGLRRIVRHGTDPPGVGADVLRNARVLVENLLPPVAGFRSPVLTDKGHDDGVNGSAVTCGLRELLRRRTRTSSPKPSRAARPH